MKLNKLIYWVATAVMCLVFLFSAGLYLVKYDMVKSFYAELQFPAWIIYPSAIAKILGVAAVLSRKSALLKEWAYAGFFFDALLATAAHHYAGHGVVGLSLLALLMVVLSRFFEARAFAKV